LGAASVLFVEIIADQVLDISAIFARPRFSRIAMNSFQAQ
jgi:hypothetical protein